MARLLSPAGSPEALSAAIAAGADEVYLGGMQFNARAGARNFSNEQLKKAGELCRRANVRLLITLNTLIADRELPAVMDYVRFLEEEVHPDAYILQDIGLAVRIKNTYPNAVLHASTQLRQHSSGGASFLRDLGFTRVVLAREMSRDDILSFTKNAGMESEVFIHGALCVCESGGCLMSSVIGQRSGNRGECAQPCRLPYQGKNPYPLSLKDNCLANHIRDLTDMGVTALKIEGRMKSPEYVYQVTSVYRKILDENRNPTKEELNAMQDAFSRTGFTDGYYIGKPSPDMFGIRREEDKKRSETIRTDVKAANIRPVQESEKPGLLSLPERDESRIFSPKKQLGYVARFEGFIPKNLSAFEDASRIDIPLWKLHQANIRGMEEKISVILPRVVFDRELPDIERLLEQAWQAGIRHATVPNLSLLSALEKFYLHGDYPLNVYSKESLSVLEHYDFSSLFISPEIDPKQFGFTAVALEALGYGRIPLMHTENCIIRNILGSCPSGGNRDCRQSERCHAELVDRTGADFPVLRSWGHRNMIYNSVVSYHLDERKERKRSGVGLTTLLFTTESEEEMQTIVTWFRTEKKPFGFPYTRR